MTGFGADHFSKFTNRHAVAASHGTFPDAPDCTCPPNHKSLLWKSCHNSATVRHLATISCDPPLPNRPPRPNCPPLPNCHLERSEAPAERSRKTPRPLAMSGQPQTSSPQRPLPSKSTTPPLSGRQPTLYNAPSPKEARL